MQPELPETYYLDNVQTLFAHVSTVYADILAAPEIEFLDGFAQLKPDARKLCIRLLNRNRDCYRASKLRYPEIDSITTAIEALAHAGFIDVNAELDNISLIALFTKAELIAALDEKSNPDKSGLDKLRRDQIEERLLQRDDADYFERLRTSDDLLQLRRRDVYQICQMLFFGNLNQSMTDFVLRDLGLYRFEAYTIDLQHRPYQSQLDIQQHWRLYQLQQQFDDSDVTDPVILQALTQQIPSAIGTASPAAGKCERLRYQIARQTERNGDLDNAIVLYQQCRLPPSRERIARARAQQNHHQRAFDTCLEMIQQPLDEQELQFACLFAARLAQRHDFELPSSITRLRIDHRPDIDDLELEYHDSVEIAVANYYAERDPNGGCEYLENSLFNGVLGLLIWEVIFAPLPGAFFNPFQYYPSDFYAADFCARRADRLQDTWAEIHGNHDIWRIVARRWQQKHGLMNPLVNWNDLDLDIIQCALERIDYQHWRAIFDRILRDLRNNRSGFPDLVQFPSNGGYCLIEVKGPGDSLQKNQQRWMQFFRDHKIPHRLARVTWKTR